MHPHPAGACRGFCGAPHGVLSSTCARATSSVCLCPAPRAPTTLQPTVYWSCCLAPSAVQSGGELSPHLEQQLKQQIGSLLRVALTVGTCPSLHWTRASSSLLDLHCAVQPEQRTACTSIPNTMLHGYLLLALVAQVKQPSRQQQSSRTCCRALMPTRFLRWARGSCRP